MIIKSILHFQKIRTLNQRTIQSAAYSSNIEIKAQQENDYIVPYK